MNKKYEKYTNIPNIQLLSHLHFYGGTVTWKPMDKHATGTHVSVMITQSYQWKRSWIGPWGSGITYCNQSIILNQTPKIPASNSYLTCVTSSCGGYVNTSIDEYCTDYSSLIDSSSGQISTLQNITAGSKFCVAFRDKSWIKVLSTVCSSSGRKKRERSKRSTTLTQTGCFSDSAHWSIGCCVDLTIRSDGFINTPPVATIISPIQVPVNTLTNIEIPVIDADNDYLKCRWAQDTTTFDECGDVCQMAPGSILEEEDCTITFNSTNKTVGDYYALTLMVEDFYDKTTNISLSSVPIQFLVLIVNTSTCSLKPTITSTLPDCSPIQVGVQFNFTLTVTQGCSGTTVKDVFTMPPLYMYKGSLIRNGTNNVWTVTETWTPNVLQLGSQVYCAVATDSANIQSDQYCTTFTVVAAGTVLSCPGDTTVGGAGGRRRRHRQKEEEKQPVIKDPFFHQKSSSSSSLLTPFSALAEDRKSKISSLISTHDSTGRISHGNDSISYTSNQQPSRTRNTDAVNMVRVSRISRPLSNNGNETIKSPFEEKNETSDIKLSKVLVTKVPRNSETKVERSGSSVLSVRHIEVPKSSFSIQQNNNQLHSAPKRTFSVSVSKMKRSVAPAMHSTSAIPRNVTSTVKRSKSTEVNVIRMKRFDLP
ncbi:unnamed protein product [Rotaria sordida]|uniref:Uncharacterized protein n=1 Tax=Rotaria sordida TaxID=392033 RepID=A0A813TXR7_9BILA|nr:unnamed protein product [Rotaria sordida]CAF4010444.1 unnamed protein product [Rotaria sordida]CAF4069169.1 unnamed protein product [Rotaria sordida]